MYRDGIGITASPVDHRFCMAATLSIVVAPRELCGTSLSCHGHWVVHTLLTFSVCPSHGCEGIIVAGYPDGQ